MVIDYPKLDEQLRKETGAPDSAWVRQTGVSRHEMRVGESLDPVAVATDEGVIWHVRALGEVTFVGDAVSARRLLWRAAAEVPSPPAAPSPRARSRR